MLVAIMDIFLGVVQSVYSVVQILHTLWLDFVDANNRIVISPSLPCSEPTCSAWQTPPSRLSNVQSLELPKNVDILIIGSGITACSVAYHLIESNPNPPQIVVLDSRNICSGATGRNGGHIKETPYLEWPGLVNRFGKKKAKDIILFRLSHLNWLLEVAEKASVVDSTEIRRLTTVDVYFEEDVWAEHKEIFRGWTKEFSDVSNQWRIWDANEARKEFKIPGAVGAITGPAGALSPYKLVTALYSQLCSRYSSMFSVETNTSVESIATDTDSYRVGTSRGTIIASHIVHATNAHTSHLLPALRTKIIPAIGQMTAICLPRELPGGTQRSWSFIWKKGFDYMTIRPNGVAMLGGGWARGKNYGIGVAGRSQDDKNQIFEQAYLTGLLPTIFDDLSSVRVEQAWTGALGISADGLPWVGEVPLRISNRKYPTYGREWICAGYSGEGMVNAWGCARGLAAMIVAFQKNEKLYESPVPSEMIITEQRVNQAHLGMLAIECM